MVSTLQINSAWRFIALTVLAAACHHVFPESLLADGKSFVADRNQAPPSGVAGTAAGEVEKRQQQVQAAQTLFTSGSKAYADQSYAEAMDFFKGAFETIPDVPAVADQRRIFFSRYQSASYRYALVLAQEAKWAECEKTLSDVLELAHAGGIPEREIDPDVKKMLKELREHDDRYNRAMTPQHLRNVDRVESKLILGRGYQELGEYDRAERAYNEALAIDPYSTSARRGLEEVDRKRMDYFDVARSHTRAKALAEVRAGWETPVPTLLTGDESLINLDGVTAGGAVAIERKMKEITIPSLEFTDARLADVLEFISQKSQELDAGESSPTQRGINILIDSTGMPEGDDVANRLLSVKLSSIPLGVAIKYVTQQVGMSYRIDNYAVRIVSPNAGADGALAVRTWIVPPSFISSGDRGGNDAGAVQDPFADPKGGGDSAALVKRITAEQFLRDRGVQFPPGATANYIATSSSLVVRNSPDQLELIDDIVAVAKSATDKNVVISVKIVSVESTALKQAGLDFLLGQGNLSSSARTFFSGGTDGNASIPTDVADFPFTNPNGTVPIGTYPVTGGLRYGDLSNGISIDDVINRDSPSPSSAKAPGIFSIAGVFTDPQFQLVLRALSQLKGADLLSDASVTTRPGQIVKMEQVREFIYPTEYDPPEIPNSLGTVTVGNIQYNANNGTFPATPANPTAFETRKLGKTIEVEPTVASDNKTVSLNVLLDFSDFSGFINYGTPITNGNFLVNGKPSVVTKNEILMPVFDAIKETTNVTIWDGQTVVIGGFHGESVIDSEDKVPYLGDLPVLGRAFRSSSRDTNKRALTIFVTVRLIDPGGNPINLPPDDPAPDLMTRREPTPPVQFAPGPPPPFVEQVK